MSTQCPNCDYTHDVMIDINDEAESKVLNGHGRFYSISNGMTMQRPERYSHDLEETPLLGCPSCGTIFIDV